jgi:hypothetical protein
MRDPIHTRATREKQHWIFSKVIWHPMALRIGFPGSLALQMTGLICPSYCSAELIRRPILRAMEGQFTFWENTQYLLFYSLVVLVCPGSLKETEARPKSVSPSASPSSSDSSSSSSTRHKKKSKKSKHDKKEAKNAAKHHKKKKNKHDRKRKHEETPAEVKLRIKIEKAEEDANKKVCIARTKSAEQVLGKLSPNIASIAGTIDKPAMEHIPVLVKCPMNDALAELKTIEDNAATIVHSQGASNIELPDMKVTVCR